MRKKLLRPLSLISRLIQRDGLVCCWCGRLCNPNSSPCSDLHPTVEHVIRRADGGKSAMRNCRVACRKCNNTRHHKVIPNLGRPGSYQPPDPHKGEPQHDS